MVWGSAGKLCHYVEEKLQEPALFQQWYLQDVGHKSLGNQAVRTQRLSGQAVVPFLSLKSH